MTTLEYEVFVNDYELGTIEFRLSARLKATETAIKILSTNKVSSKNTIETLYRQGIILMTVLNFFNKTYNVSEWISKFAKYIHEDSVTVDTSLVLTDSQKQQLIEWFKQWNMNGFVITDDTDMTPYVASGMVEVTKDDKYHLYFYMLTDKAKKLIG